VRPGLVGSGSAEGALDVTTSEETSGGEDAPEALPGSAANALDVRMPEESRGEEDAAGVASGRGRGGAAAVRVASA
jgi:hypothetical protein